MKNFYTSKASKLIGAPFVLSFALAGCGDGDNNDNGIALVARAVPTLQVTSTSQVQRKAFAAAKIEIVGAKCYLATPAHIATLDGGLVSHQVPPVLFVYEIRRLDINAASALGFQQNVSQDGFDTTKVSCEDAPGIPAASVGR